MGDGGFDSRMKLKVLRSMIPDYMRYLVPTKIVSDLSPYILNEDQVREICEKERHSRREAVKLLMDAIIEKGDAGLSYFINALKQGDSNYERFLNPLEDQDDTQTAESSNHREINKYFSFIIRCLEGDIIRSLTGTELEALMMELYSSKLIDSTDIDELREMNSFQRKAVHLFRLLPQASTEWPLKLFRALNIVKPEIVPKCDPLGELPYHEMDKQAMASHNAQEAASNSEETQPKTQRTPSNEGTSEEVAMADEEELLAAGSEEESCEFSDGENEEKEDADVDQDVLAICPGTEKAAQPKHLSLRKYQYELAAPALKGENTIICAPTGSGKTRVALYITKEHLESGVRQGKDPKVIFMARTVPLVSQQFKIFEKYLSDFRCTMVHGETTGSEALHLMLDDFDILVMTPKILENHLIYKKISSLSVFSLIIFDECHHTRKGEPYNSVMKYYLQFKKAGEKNLPQIVGLTASIGVEKASTVDTAHNSIIDIMANLDVNSITKVKDNLEELNETVPTPDERLEELMPRADDDVSTSIYNNMREVEHLLTEQFTRHCVNQEFLSVQTLLGKRPAERNSQKYGQWAVKVCDQARRVHIPDQPRNQRQAEMIERRRLFSQNVQILAETLIAYNEALDVHELTRPEDVLEHLKKKLDPRHPADSPDPTAMEIKLLKLFKDLQKKLRSAGSAPNPNLQKLSAVIEDIMARQWDTSRVMIFVRTRATCRALCSWMNTDASISPQLRALKASPFTGTGAHQEHGGMTQHEQEGVIEKFRAGDVKLLVCTTVGQEGMDIPDCNLVIRYNQVGNEVATVQTRGRSRKNGGVSVLLAMPEVIRKERINKRRVEIMNQAIEMVNSMRAKEVTNKVTKAQKLAMDKDEMKKIASRKAQHSQKRQGSFTLQCAKCRRVRVPGSSIRTIENSHHVIIGNHLLERGDVSIKIREEPMQLGNVQFTGELICNRCPVMKQNHLGTGLKYQEAEFLTVKAMSWLVLDDRQMVVMCGKWKWKDIPYDIPEMTPQDMNVHLGLPPDDEDGEGAVGGTLD